MRLAASRAKVGRRGPADAARLADVSGGVRMHRYVVMGPQGCGKGTQAAALAAELGVPHVSTGELFRRVASAGGEQDRRVAAVMAAGALVPDDRTIALVEARLAARDCRRGFVLDGFPRNLAQTTNLLERHPPDAVVLIEVPDRVSFDRVLARRHCGDCGRDHNLLLRRLRRPGRCDACDGRLVRRDDDTPEAVRRRLADYHRRTAPVLDLFRQRRLLVAVDGTPAPAAVAAAIRTALGLTTGSSASASA
jgi:adenylate kinase